MTADQIKKMLHDAFNGSTESKRLWSELQKNDELLSTARARAIEFSDRYELLAEKIALAENELETINLTDISFEKLSAKRKTLRELQADLEDIAGWNRRILQEVDRLISERKEMKRQLDEAIHGEVFNPVYQMANQSFSEQVERCDKMYVDWIESLALFRSEIGGMASPKLHSSNRNVASACGGL